VHNTFNVRKRIYRNIIEPILIFPPPESTNLWAWLLRKCRENRDKSDLQNLKKLFIDLFILPALGEQAIQDF